MFTIALLLLTATPNHPAPWEGNAQPTEAVQPPRVAPLPPERAADGGDHRDERTLLYTSPVELLLTVANVELERNVTGHAALYAGGGLSVLGVASHWQAGGRWYFDPLAESGWRAFADLHAAQVHLALWDAYDQLGGGGQAGVRLITPGGLAWSLGGGADLAFVHATTNGLSLSGARERAGWEVVPSARLSVGYAF